MNDRELHKLAQKYGSLSLKYRHKFLGLLPEIENRRIYKRYGFHSVFEYAARLAGVSNDTVRKLLRLHSKLDDKPILRKQLISGDYGWTKIREVAKIATPQNEKILAEKVRTMTYRGIETLVRDTKSDRAVVLHEQQAQKPDFLKMFNIRIRRKTENKLRILKRKLEKEKKQPLSWDEALNEIITKLSEPEPKPRKQRRPNPTSRYIPVAIRRKLSKICMHPNCNKPADAIHHPKPWARHKKHENLQPLCKTHHEIAHHELIEPETWKIELRKTTDPINLKFQKMLLSNGTRAP